MKVLAIDVGGTHIKVRCHGNRAERKGRGFEDYVGKAGLGRLGREKWQKHVEDVGERLRAAFVIDNVVIGGGNVKKLKRMPAGARAGDNENAFRGGARMWEDYVYP